MSKESDEMRIIKKKAAGLKYDFEKEIEHILNGIDEENKSLPEGIYKDEERINEKGPEEYDKRLEGLKDELKKLKKIKRQQKKINKLEEEKVDVIKKIEEKKDIEKRITNHKKH